MHYSNHWHAVSTGPGRLSLLKSVGAQLARHTSVVKTKFLYEQLINFVWQMSPLASYILLPMLHG